MRALILSLAVAALALGTLPGCKEKTDKAQADISKGNPEGQILRKKYEAANKDADQQRQAQDK